MKTHKVHNIVMIIRSSAVQWQGDKANRGNNNDKLALKLLNEAASFYLFIYFFFFSVNNTF